MNKEFVVAAKDVDPVETKEWIDALKSVVKYTGPERAEFILRQLFDHAKQLKVKIAEGINTPYLNTLPEHAEEKLPDDPQLIENLMNYMRWNTIAMVCRSDEYDKSLGGHIASYLAIATLFEIGFHYFFHATNDKQDGDLIYFQGHSAEGIYARAFFEGRISEENLEYFRREIEGDGVSSYPHPHLMPDFWQFPTVSMGLGPIMSIYQAQFLKYLQARGLRDTAGRHVWAFCGDGEMGEPESLGALNIAGREKLDNLIFVINCNFQRLDGPVYGNGQIIQEYEAVFRGAGWNVIKLIWGSDWCQLINKDKSGLLIKRMDELVDGEYQNYSVQDGAYLREHFFGKYPELLELVKDKSDAELKTLTDGGHDLQKVYAAYTAAVKHKGQPTVLLIKTVKGFGLGEVGEAKNITHNLHEVNSSARKIFRDRFHLALSDEQVEKLDFVKPSADSPEMKFLFAQREKLGGFLPSRTAYSDKLTVPPLEAFKSVLEGTGERSISTNMAFVRVLAVLLKDKNVKDRVVPIVADESRTLGMEGLFRQIGIYSHTEQRYTPEDHKQLVFYCEKTSGQLLQQGITESGAMASWIAAATSYANNKIAMIPVFIYYAMFGYQRFGDLVWASGDIHARGFIVGGLAGRTTLAGEGLQHQDAHNLLMFSFVPNCVTYDPCFGYEIAVIVQDGLRRMYQEEENIFYYLTVMNENYVHPALPQGVEKNILKGMYLFKESSQQTDRRVQLLGSGAILREVIAAAEILERQFNVAADIWGVTSFNELRRDILAIEHHNRFHPDEQKQSHVAECLKDRRGPVIAATDYLKLFADQIRIAIKQPYYVLGTDGFGRSDTRAVLREFFEVDAKHITYMALSALAEDGKFDKAQLKNVMEQLKIDPQKPEPKTL